MVLSTRSRGPSPGPELLWHLAEFNFGESSVWPTEVASIILHAMPTGKEGRHHAPARASETGNSHSLAPALVIRKDARKDVAWTVKKKRTISVLAAATQVATPNSSGAGQEHLKSYTRRRVRSPLVPAAAVAALPEVTCEPNCVEKDEEKSESVPTPKLLKLRGQRSSRKRREIPRSPLAPILPGIPIAKDDENNGDTPEPNAANGRPRREAKRKYDKDFVRSDSMFFDWTTTYPDEPCPPDYHDVPDCHMQLGDVETISTYEEEPLDIRDPVERPMSLKLQTEIQHTRKARRILVEESRLPVEIRGGQEQTEAPSVPPPADQHDESVMCPPTPEKLQESNGECEGDRHPSTLSEGIPDKDSFTPSDNDSSRDISDHLPDSATERTSDVHVTSNRKKRKKVKLMNKHSRPKVKRLQKVKVAKPSKIPNIPKTFERKSSSRGGAFEHNNAKSRAKGTAVRIAQTSKRGRQYESVPSSKPEESALAVTAEVPHMSTEGNDCSFEREGKICIDLPISVVTSGTNNQVECEDGRGECIVAIIENSSVFERRAECNPRLEAPGGPEMTMEKILESDVPLQSCSVIQCNRNYGGFDSISGGSSMEEYPPSTPRENVVMVPPPTHPFPSSPSFSNQPPFEDGDSSTESDGEQTGPTRRKRSNLKQRTRRSLVLAVEAAGNPPSVLAPVAQPEIPFFLLTEAQQRQYAWALCKNPRFSEDPMGLVDVLISDTPEYLVSELKAKIGKLVFDINGKEVSAEDPANQIGRNLAAQAPLSIHSRETRAREQLQLVVYGQKPSGMVVYQEMRSKVKYKPKVFLDPMTINTFDKLMLQGGEVKDADHADENWVEARKLWSDRAHHFNCTMRQVQGDRTFSKWRGSLLDSVVGAFLTQNVSDFLSSNAFMELRAHFPVREASRSGSSPSSEEQFSVSVSGCPVGTSLNTDFSTSQTAEDQSDSVGVSKENVVDAGIDNLQESVSPLPDAEILDGQVVSEASITHSPVDITFVEKSHDPPNIIVEPLSSDEAQRGLHHSDQPDPYSFSDEERSVNSDLVIAFKAVHIGSTSVTQAIYSAMDMASPSAGLPDERITENVDNATTPVTETISEVTPEVANTVQYGGDSSDGHHSGTQADTEDRGENGNQSDMARGPAQAGKAPSRSSSVLEAKFQCFLNDGLLTPDDREKTLAAALRRILGKRIIERETAEGQLMPLDIVKWKTPRNRRPVNVTRFKTKIKFLTGADRGNYELKVSYRLNSEQKVTWEAVRADVLSNKECQRDPFTADSVDWEAVRRADVSEVANVIKERGMHYMLGGRIKSLLERIHHDQDGRLDLEWIRKLSPINAQNFLTSVRGLGLKSVECIRLLTLHHPSFPVDTNVGRIVVRLGWVPLEPLPEETQLHLLETYPVQEQIQKYMWPRLCTLDQQTLYEFHYQLITFGKVFCTKSKPNCNACPMRSHCKHYESAHCSARPLLQGPGRASNTTIQVDPLMSRLSMQPPLERRQSTLMFGDQVRASSQGACIPIIEEPNSPEYMHDIEDIALTENCTNVETSCVLSDVDPDLEPSLCPRGSLSMFDKPMVHVDLNETSTQDNEEFIVENMTDDAVQETEMSIEDVVDEAILQSALGDQIAHLPSQELVLVPPEVASFPAPPLKNVQRLRTIHYVYELPDHHPFLAKMDKRDPEDPCFYLLAIWNSDEVPEIMPKISDDDASNPFACSQPGEAAVRGTLLVPCRTAMRGSFPLNGTYFQVNEVFADHASSIVPIDVPRTLLWDLRRRFVYFGTSVTSIFKDMSQEEIQCCFKKGYVCVRAFDQSTRQPKLLAARLHQSGAKIVAGRTLAKRGRRLGPSKS
ncbi:hypothetical protein M758_6G001700 [Ceratodon purpureus]|nr:hypothetical protein M758_6G001700 [Ceratodon purpureus]